jgi:hypothetical protein
VGSKGAVRALWRRSTRPADSADRVQRFHRPPRHGTHPADSRGREGRSTAQQASALEVTQLLAEQYGPPGCRARAAEISRARGVAIRSPGRRSAPSVHRVLRQARLPAPSTGRVTRLMDLFTWGSKYEFSTGISSSSGDAQSHFPTRRVRHADPVGDVVALVPFRIASRLCIVWARCRTTISSPPPRQQAQEADGSPPRRLSTARAPAGHNRQWLGSGPSDPVGLTICEYTDSLGALEERGQAFSPTSSSMGRATSRPSSANTA